jgi:hypothetical protein
MHVNGGVSVGVAECGCECGCECGREWEMHYTYLHIIHKHTQPQKIDHCAACARRPVRLPTPPLIHTHTFRCSVAHACMHTHTHTHTHTRIRTHVHTPHTNTQIYTNTLTSHALAHARACVNTHTHTLTYTSVLGMPLSLRLFCIVRLCRC